MGHHYSLSCTELFPNEAPLVRQHQNRHNFPTESRERAEEECRNCGDNLPETHEAGRGSLPCKKESDGKAKEKEVKLAEAKERWRWQVIKAKRVRCWTCIAKGRK